ncbi:MAG: type 1 glutamine amidotransferase domain-containing protein [Candidatus Uhrbacteria bacterium]|nr:type 1 glutamine amidotransferase domain-containing protein [Candidatus Uhrbacteria bacterium]
MQRKVAILLENDFRDEEAIYPYYRLQEEQYEVVIATDKKKEVRGKFGIPLLGTAELSALNADDFDGVIIPGGNEGPDRLRMNEDVLKFVREMYEKNKLVAAICHGVWIPISAKIMTGKRATCYRAIIDDLKNAGGLYEDSPAVIDGNLITSRHPRDLPIFTKAVVDFLNK